MESSLRILVWVWGIIFSTVANQQATHSVGVVKVNLHKIFGCYSYSFTQESAKISINKFVKTVLETSTS